ncbi:MAG: TetR family transcriptional regulator [Actinomycetota bacterium]
MSRKRRTPDEARAEILAAAAALLAEGGVAAVQMRTIAQRIGMTDAGVAHHLGSRDDLLRELVTYGGRQIATAVDDALTRWRNGDGSLEQLIASLGDAYRDGYAELALALYQSGWRSRGAALLEPVVTELQRRRRDRGAPISETQVAVAALHQAVAFESLFGREFRRSAGLGGAAGDTAETYRWWATALRTSLDLAD